MPGRQRRGCSRSGSSRARRRRQRGPLGRAQAAAEIGPAPRAPGLLPDSPAAAAESGRRRRRRRIPGSAIPRCPGWGETAASHFLSNSARRPTSLATSVNFNNFIGTLTAGREILRGRRGRDGYWRLAGAQCAWVFFTHLRSVRREQCDLTPPAAIWCLSFPICKMERTAVVPPRNFSRRLTFPKAISQLSDLRLTLLLRSHLRSTWSVKPKTGIILVPSLSFTPYIQSVSISSAYPLVHLPNIAPVYPPFSIFSATTPGQAGLPSSLDCLQYLAILMALDKSLSFSEPQSLHP